MKILYVTTISNTVNAFLIPHIKLLIEQGHQVDVAFNIVQEVNQQLIELGCTVHNIEFQRSPIDRLNYLAYKKLRRIINDGGYDVVHTHTPVASVCVRLACRRMENVKVIYTAHGFHFYRGAALINWALYFPIELWLSKYTDILITINKEDYEFAKKILKPGKVEYIPGIGMNTAKFSQVNEIKLDKRYEIGLPNDSIVLLSVGELNRNKNHETVIKALAKINNPDIYYVICGTGPLENYLRDLIVKLGLENRVKLLGYRKDITEICKMSDIFIFPSIREGLGLAALEAMASGIPIITSNVHGIKDYSKDGITGYSCCPTDVNGFAKSIKNLISNSKLREEMGNRNIEVVKKFDIKEALSVSSKIYKGLG